MINADSPNRTTGWPTATGDVQWEGPRAVLSTARTTCGSTAVPPRGDPADGGGELVAVTHPLLEQVA